MALNIKDLLLRELSSKQLESIDKAAVAAESLSFNIYLIGGIVRDLILGNSVSDIDIAVEGNAVTIAKELQTSCNCEIINIQENLRTSKVRFSNGTEIDFASTRQEEYEYSGKLPIACNLGCELKEDVTRRDFTINTLAIKLTGRNRYRLIDYYKGYNDIINKQIRILHKKSFIDDPSRIIRALKFSVRFGFEIEPATYKLMQEYLMNINTGMPLERIKNELLQYFAINSNKLYDRIIGTNAYKLISDNPIKNIHEECLKEIYDYEIIKAEDIPFVYFAALCVNSDYENIRLNLSSREKQVLKETKMLLDASLTEYSADKKIYIDFKKCNNLSIVCFYLFAENKSAAVKYLQKLKNIKIEINGNDLIKLGLKPSDEFGKIFDNILEKKLSGEIKSKQEEIQFVKEYMMRAKK